MTKTTLTDCLALFIACLFCIVIIALIIAVFFLGLAATVYVIVWAAATALKAVGVIHLEAMLI